MPRWLRLVERPPCNVNKKAAGQGFKSLSRLNIIVKIPNIFKGTILILKYETRCS